MQKQDMKTNYSDMLGDNRRRKQVCIAPEHTLNYNGHWYALTSIAKQGYLKW